MQQARRGGPCGRVGEEFGFRFFGLGQASSAVTVM